MTPLPVSMLYMPGSNARALEKARTLNADALIFDLEDAVAPDAKSLARDTIKLALDEGGYAPRPVIVRMNGLETQWAKDDLHFVASLPIDGVLLPKVNTLEDLWTVRRALEGFGSPDFPLWAMVETPLSLLNLPQIGAGAKDVGLVGLIAGTNDLIKEMGAAALPDRSNLAFALSMLVTTAKAYNLAVIDSVFNAIDDQEGLRAETLHGKAMGFDGKSLIHPAQIDICHTVYEPTPEEVECAQAIIAAFDAPENQGKGALKLAGKMVERLHYDMAKTLLGRRRG